jgi:Na+-transporting methylmalonyl-CoA/oxaloacetate decarboxylase gamma subunit
MLAEGSFKKFRLHIVGDGVVFIILLILSILVVVAYNFTPSLSVSV